MEHKKTVAEDDAVRRDRLRNRRAASADQDDDGRDTLLEDVKRDAYRRGYEDALNREPLPLTREDVANMSVDEVNANWEAVAHVLELGL